MRHFVRRVSQHNLGLCIGLCILIALLLAGKNPFDNQSLIPNLEPYPDSLYYAYPSWNLVHGGDFSMTYNDVTVKNVTPPLFSLFLVPFFMLIDDVRAFHLAQLALLICSTVLLTTCIKQILSYYKVPYLANVSMIFLSTFFFVTNFYIYTMPSLLMAELISITLFLVGSVLLLLPITPRRASLAGHIGMLFLLIKMSNLPLTFVFYVFCILKVWKSNQRKNFLKHMVFAIAYTGSYFYFTHFFESHKNLQSGSTFSFSYFWNNLHFYAKTLLGSTTRYLWYTEKFVSPVISIGALVSAGVGLTMKESKKIVLAILFTALSLVLFMSFFVTPDARYISSLIPLYSFLWIIGLVWLQRKIQFSHTFIVALGGFLILYMFVPAFSYQAKTSEIQVLKKQIGLNFLHPEDPWNYNAVDAIDRFSSSSKSEGPIYIATFLPQFYVGMFAKNFTVLPVSTQQEFYSSADEDTISHLYEAAFRSGRVYLSNAYINNLPQIWPQEFKELLIKYNGKLAYEGCLGTCNLYLLTLPSETQY